MRKVMTVSELKSNAANLDLNDESLLITQNGKPKYVVESYEDHERKEEAIALLRIVAMAEVDIKRGRVLSREQMKARLENMRPEVL